MDENAAPHGVGALYQEYYPLLAKIALGRFSLPREEVENAIHDVFVSFLRTSGSVDNPRAWLVGGICNACRDYWRAIGNRRLETLPVAEATSAAFDRNILCDQVLARLPESSRAILALHYVQGLTAGEIAQELNTSLAYAEQLIHRSLKRARLLARRRA